MPATSGAIRAGRAYIEFFADDSELVKGIKQAQSRLKSLSMDIGKVGLVASAAGAGITGAFAKAVGIFDSVGSAIGDMAARTGMSAEMLSSLDLAAQKSGATLDDVGRAVQKMNQGIGDTLQGTGGAKAAFDALGLSAEKLSKLNTDDRLRAISDALKGVAEDAKRTSLANKIFGDTFKTSGILTGGTDAINAAMKQAGNLGVILNQADIKAAADYHAAWAELSAVFKKAAFDVGKSLLPDLLAVGKQLVAGTQWVIQLVKHNQDLIRTAAKVGVALSAAGVAIAGIAASIFGASVALGVLATTLTTIGAVASVAFAAITSPIALSLAAVAGLTAAIAKFSGIWNNAKGTLIDGWKSVSATFTDVWDGIVNAVKKGDLTAAAKLAWAGLQLEWVKGKNVVLDIWGQMWLNVRESYITVMADITKGFTTSLNYIGDKITSLMRKLQDLGGSISDWFKGVWAGLKLNAGGTIDDYKKAMDAIQGKGAIETERTHQQRMTSDASTQAQRNQADIAAADKLAKTLQNLANNRQNSVEKYAADLAAAQANFADALARANAPSPDKPPVGLGGKPDAFLDNLQNTLTTTFGSIGTFSKAALNQVSGGKSPEQKTAENTAKMIDLMKENNRLTTSATNALTFG